MEDINKYEFFNQITQHLIEGVVLVNSYGVIQNLNNAVEVLFGYEKDELIDKKVEILLPSQRKYEQDFCIDKDYVTGEIIIPKVDFEAQFQHKNGKSFVANFKINEIIHKNQKFYMVTICSLQRQKDADAKILNQTELLEKTEEIAGLGHWWVRLKNDEIYWSKEIYRIHGVTTNDYIPDLESAYNFYIPEDRKRIKKIIDESIYKKSKFEFEASIRRPCDEIRHVKSFGECGFNDKGEVESIFGVLHDITDQKNIKLKLENQNTFLKQIMDNIPDLLFVKDEKYRIVDANNAFLNIYPHKNKKEIIGFTTVEDYEPLEAKQFLKHDKEAFENGKSETEETLHFPDGKIRTLYTKKVRFTDVDNNHFVLGIARDITSIKKTQLDLEQINEELEEFSYRTSHDLRAPLISAIGLVKVISLQISSGNIKIIEQSLEYLSKSLIQLEELAESILDLKKIQSFDEKVESVSLAFLVSQTLEKLAHLENFKRLEIRKDIEVDKFLVKKFRLQFVIENLVSNAIKYQDTSKEVSFVNISTRKEKFYLVIEIRDNGLGIPKNKKQELFSMFKRFHPKVSHGSGLGLYMIKKSIKHLNGFIEFSNKNNQTTFTVKIPIHYS